MTSRTLSHLELALASVFAANGAAAAVDMRGILAITGREASPTAGVQTLSRKQSSLIGALPVSASPISGIIGRAG